MSYRGYEREDRLVATTVFENAEVLRPAEAALELLQMPCDDVERPFDNLSVTLADLDEVVDEEFFADQAQAAGRKLSRSRERSTSSTSTWKTDCWSYAVAEEISRRNSSRPRKSAMQRSVPMLGGSAEARLRRLEGELADIDGQIERLTARDDRDYDRWKTDAHRRRYEPPQAERLFNLEFVIA